MALDEIVIGEVQGNGGLEVFEFLTESVGEAGQSAHVKTGRAVQPLDVACRS